jgi:lactoylglutathione lyase
MFMRAFTAMRLRLELFVADMDASVRFYTDVLGYRVVRREETYASLRRGAAALGLGAVATLPEDGAGPGFTQARLAGDRGAGVEIVLEVPDLDAAYEQARAAGAKIAEPPRRQPWGLRDFRLADPDGYYVRVTAAT